MYMGGRQRNLLHDILASRQTSAVNLDQVISVERELLLFKRWMVGSVVAYGAPMLG